MNRSCQRQTQVFDLPVEAMIAPVPIASADNKMIRARLTCRCGEVAAKTIASRRGRAVFGHDFFLDLPPAAVVFGAGGFAFLLAEIPVIVGVVFFHDVLAEEAVALGDFLPNGFGLLVFGTIDFTVVIFIEPFQVLFFPT